MMHRFPFEADFHEIENNPDPYVNAIFSCLESEFLIMPKGNGFIEFTVFEQGYEALKTATSGFSSFEPKEIFPVLISTPISMVVLRSMLGFTPPEWAYITSQRSNEEVSQGFARSIDRKIRMDPKSKLKLSETTKKRIEAMLITACQLLTSEPHSVGEKHLHRLNKVDTVHGVDSLKNMARLGTPYAILLYERFLGRPFAGHRDSVSELIGDSLESAIEEVLTNHGISFRKTKRAERIEGFDQVPDFIIPSEFNPQVIIEAKITEDDGTARDKATRIQHLGELSLVGRSADNPKYEVIACIGGRGFAVRREDMIKMLHSTRGKVFTLQTLDRLVECSRLSVFKTS